MDHVRVVYVPKNHPQIHYLEDGGKNLTYHLSSLNGRFKFDVPKGIDLTFFINGEKIVAPSFAPDPVQYLMTLIVPGGSILQILE
jgi:hypothetical protein